MFQTFPNQGGTATADPQVAGLNGQSRVPEMFGNVIAGTMPGVALPYNGYAFNPVTPFGGPAFHPYFGSPTIGTPTPFGTNPFVSFVPQVPTYNPYLAATNFATPFQTLPTYWNNPYATGGCVTPYGINPFVTTYGGCPTPSPLAFNPFWTTNPAFVNWTGLVNPTPTVNPFVGTPNVIPTPVNPFVTGFNPIATTINPLATPNQPFATINPFTGTLNWTTGWNPGSFRGVSGFNGFPHGFNNGYSYGTTQPFWNTIGGFPTTGFNPNPSIGFHPTGIPNTFGTPYEGLISGLANPFCGTTPWNGVSWNTPSFFSMPGHPNTFIHTTCGPNPTVAYTGIHPITGAPNPFFSPTQVAHGIPGYGAVTVQGNPFGHVVTNPATSGLCCN
jgi:hypothetical protein